MDRLKQRKLVASHEPDLSIEAQVAEMLPRTLAGRYDQRAFRRTLDRMWLTVEAYLAKSAELLKKREGTIADVIFATGEDATTARRDEMLEVLSVEAAANEVKTLSNLLEMAVHVERLYKVLKEQDSERRAKRGGN